LLHFGFYPIDHVAAPRDVPGLPAFIATRSAMKKYMCLICGWIYDEAVGSPEDGIPPGTHWDDVPPNWTCPECGARKEDFEMIEL
jgi:rubredoxin